jgi:hypothetical protein
MDRRTAEHLGHSYKRVLVLIYERVKTGQYLRIFKRYRYKLLFAGKTNVPEILLAGDNVLVSDRQTGHWCLIGTTICVRDGLMAIMNAANLDDSTYQVVEWFQKNGGLIVRVTKQTHLVEWQA